MRIYVVSAHDREQSLCGAIFNRAGEKFADDGHEVSFLALYDHASKIPFFADKKQLEENVFFQNMRREVMRADAIFLVFPVFWYGPPAILKAWCDLITGYAWSYEGGDAARPLHHIQRVFWINSFMAYAPHEKKHGSIASRQLEETFRWMGMPNRSWYEIPDVFKHDDQTLDEHIERAIAEAATWFAQNVSSAHSADTRELERHT